MPRPTALPPLLLLACLAAMGCADSADATGDEALPAGPRLLAVTRRDATWTRGAGAPAVTPLTLAWDFADGAQGWTGPADLPLTVEAGRLQLSGDGQAVAHSPDGATLSPEVQHWLSLRLRARGARSLVVQWRGGDDGYSPQRATSPLPLTADGEWQVLNLPLASLRGARDAGDVSQGVRQFKFVFQGEGPGEVAVTLDSVALVSDFDAEEQGAARSQRLEIDGQRRDGVVARPGASLSTRVELDRPGRLRLAFAAAAARRPLDVTVNVGDQRQELAVRPRDGWVELALERPAGISELTLSVAPGDEAGERASLFVSGPLLLQPSETARPLVLLYVEDTLRRDRLSVYGHTRVTDPSLVALAAQGVVMTQAHAASSWTRPSISTLLTSLDPPSHGNRTHLTRVGEQVTTLAEAFADAGYLTVSFVTNYHGGAWAGLDQGFDLACEPTAYDASLVASTLTSAAITPPLMALLEDHADEQLFVHVHTLDPHAPYAPDISDLSALAPGARSAEPPLRLRYDAEVHHNDRQLGLLADVLVRRGLDAHTLLCFTSDHGEAFGDHGHDEHRQSLHVAETAVPWVLRWPARLPAGLRLDLPVTHLDLAPTLAGLAGVPIPASWQGRDLTPALSGGSVPDTQLLGDLLFERPRDGRVGQLSVVHRQRDGAVFKLLLDLDSQQLPTPRALYRLDQDPEEQHDLLADSPELAAPMAAWAAEALRRGAATARAETATEMDPATRAWMAQLGYLGDDGR